jgi:hypothetical protein
MIFASLHSPQQNILLPTSCHAGWRRVGGRGQDQNPAVIGGDSIFDFGHTDECLKHRVEFLPVFAGAVEIVGFGLESLKRGCQAVDSIRCGCAIGFVYAFCRLEPFLVVHLVS